MDSQYKQADIRVHHELLTRYTDFWINSGEAAQQKYVVREGLIVPRVRLFKII